MEGFRRPDYKIILQYGKIFINPFMFIELQFYLNKVSESPLSAFFQPS
jgi:hypothetical protein